MTKEDIILAKDLVNSADESSQLRSLIYSYLKSAESNTDPTQASKTKTIRDILSQYDLKRFNPTSTRYSKAFIRSANLYRIGASANGMSLFHPESFVPRRVNLNLTTRMFGYSINPLEVDARMEGMETV